MQPHEERVVEELKDLKERLRKLDLFIAGNPHFEALPADERMRMRDQSRAMEKYAAILQERIDHFPKADSAGS
jgi:hypothetical protein